MRCLLLGGAGFLGSHISELLLEKGYSVRIFEKAGFSEKNLEGIKNQVEIIVGDINDSAQVKDFVQGIDFVYHLMSTTLPANSNVNPIHDVATNIIPTIQLLDNLYNSNVKKVVFFSSGGTVYGVPETTPIKETHPTNPICSYGIHKLVIEKYLALYHHLYGLDYSVLRISNAYGKRQKYSTGQGIVAAFIHHLLQGETIEIWGDGSVIRDYVHVSDVVQAAIRCMEYQGDAHIFNIGSGVGMTVLEVLNAVEDAVGNRTEVTYLKERPYDVPINILDIGLAKEELSWVPLVTFTEGLAMTL